MHKVVKETIDNVYELTDEKIKALSSTVYTSKSMKEYSHFLILQKNLNKIGCTVIGDKFRNLKLFFLWVCLTKLQKLNLEM